MFFHAAASAAVAEEPLPAKIEFNRDVRPILADHCFGCHGPDEKQRQGELRLDTAEGLSAERGSGPVVIAGQPEKSELIRRITSADADERMPPAGKGRPLSKAQTAVLVEWVRQGAVWQKHWSLLPVERPALPQLQKQGAAQGPLDTFILQRLAQEGLAPSPAADKHTLLRRVTLTLTGLPPTAEEIAAFAADGAPDAYERVVDRLLASPRYGERMAAPWLDAARYADTSGYQSDGERYMWRWRDWVIDALNTNMPFDQFTVEQIAGDLLSGATLEQRIATGFNRNHRGNAEGGIIPEEYAVEYVADRVETTATVWLGLTLGCCRCHDHKFDPFTQREFYSLFAFFNNVPEKGRAIKIGNSPPYIAAPTREQRETLTRLERRAAASEAAFAALANEIESSQAAWEQASRQLPIADWQPDEGLIASFPFDGDTGEKIHGQKTDLQNGSCEFAPGAVGQAAEFDGKALVVAGDVANFGFFDKFTLAAWVNASAGGGTIVSRMVDAPEGEGYQLAIVKGKLQLNLVKRWLDDALRMETAASVPSGGWHHVAATYDGSRVAEGVKLYVDGRLQAPNVLLDELNQTFATKQPLAIGGGGGPEMRFRGGIDQVLIYRRALDADDIQILATTAPIGTILEIAPEKRSAGERLKLRECFVSHYAQREIQASDKERTLAAEELAKFREGLPTVMVMEEMSPPRETHVLVRGQYDKPGERVEPGVPRELPAWPDGAPRNRLGLAQWLVDPANPLTSRVLANRVWQLHFGTGLVKTPEDFGRQGEWPSHPDLLDWLADEFRGREPGARGRGESSRFKVPSSKLVEGEKSVPSEVGETLGPPRWDVKRLHRIIVTSGTFRRSSRVTPALVTRDPENRLLARGPRLRLPAEMVRDQALFVSGQMVEQVGGPSVKPYQPPGLWSELTGGDDYKPGVGADLVRRSLYTFWKRTIPPPALATFDAPTREFCSVRESRTNTPLQALALLNEPTFVEASRALAERVMREVHGPNDQIARAFLLVLGRQPTEQEERVLRGALERYRSANEESAALALVCGTILNLDEAVTRQ